MNSPTVEELQQAAADAEATRHEPPTVGADQLHATATYLAEVARRLNAMAETGSKAG